jgi:aminopeptidase
MQALPPSAIDAAQGSVRDILDIVVEHAAPHRALVVYDARTALAAALTEAYRRNLPDATFVDFDAVDPEQVHAAFGSMQSGDLVVLIQSTNFRLEAFRIRVELFKLGLKVIEHVHLSRMPGVQGELYLESLAYDPAYYRGVGKALKARIDSAARAVVRGDGLELVFESGFEPAKLNVGDYSEMNNVGGQFPIGEVFTEARDLEAVNGRVRVHVFGDTTYHVNRPETPITLVVEKGRVVDAIDSTPEFDTVLSIIRRDEGEVWLRELGFGMNRAFTRERRKDARYHIDVFAVTDAVLLDGQTVYAEGAWRI